MDAGGGENDNFEETPSNLVNKNPYFLVSSFYTCKIFKIFCYSKFFKLSRKKSFII